MKREKQKSVSQYRMYERIGQWTLKKTLHCCNLGFAIYRNAKNVLKYQHSQIKNLTFSNFKAEFPEWLLTYIENKSLTSFARISRRSDWVVALSYTCIIYRKMFATQAPYKNNSQ